MSEDEELEEGELDDDDDGDIDESTPVATVATDTVKFHGNAEDKDEAIWKARSPTENQGHRLSSAEGRHDVGIVDLETSPADDIVVAQHLHGSSHRHGEARRRKHEAGNRASKKGQIASYIDLDDFVDDPCGEDQTVSHGRGGQEYRVAQKLQSSKRTQNNVWSRSPRGAYDSPHSCSDSEPELLDITDPSPERSDNDTEQWQYDMSGHPDRHGSRRRHHRHHTAHSTGNSKDYEESPVPRGFSKDGAHSRSHRMLLQQQSRKRKLVDTPMDERPICRFFQEGKCSKGDDCPFNHECPPRKPEPCRFYLGNGCFKGDSCMYYHGDWPCRKYHRFGNCPLGSLCKFSHVELNAETRKLLDVPCEDEQQPPSDTSSIIEARKIPSLLDIVVYLPGTAPNQSPPGTVPRNLWSSLPIFKSQHFVELDEEINGDSQKPSVKQNTQSSSQGAGDEDDIYYDLEDDEEQYSSEQQTDSACEPLQQHAGNQHNATESVEDVEPTAEQLFDDCKEKSGIDGTDNSQPDEIRELDTEVGDDVRIMDDDKLSRLPAAQRQLYFRIKNNQRQVDDAGISTEEKNLLVTQDNQNYRVTASGNAIERNREDNWYSSDEDDDGSSKPAPMSSEAVPVSPQQQNSAPVVSTNPVQQPAILFNVPPPPLLPPPMQSGVMAPPPFRIPPPLMQQQPSGPPPMGLAMRGMPPPGMAGANMSQNMMVPPFGQEVPPGFVRPVTGPRHLLPPGFVGPGSSPMTMPGQNSATNQGPPQPPVFGSQNMMGQGPLQPLLGPPAGNQPRMNPVPLLGPGPAGSQNFMSQGPPSLLGPGPVNNQVMVNQGPQPLLGPSGGQGMLGHGVPSLLGPGGIGQGPQPLLGQGPPPLLGQGPGGNSNSMGPGPQPLSNQQQASQTALGASSGSSLLNQAINLPQFDIAQILSAIQNNMSTASSSSSTNNNDVSQTAGTRDIRTGNQLSNDPRLRMSSKASDSSEMTTSSSVVVSVLPPASPPASPTDDVEVNAGGQRVAYILRKLTLTAQLPSVPAHVSVDELKERNDPRLGRYQVFDKTVAQADAARLFVTDSVVSDRSGSDLNRQQQRSPPMYTLPDIVLPPLPLPGSSDAIPSAAAAKLAGKVPGLDGSVEMPKPLHERRTSTPADQSSDASGPKKVIDYRNDPRYKKKKTLNPSKDAAVRDATFASEQSCHSGGSGSGREAFVSNYCRSSSTDEDDNAPGPGDFAVFGSYSDSDKRNAKTGLAAAAGWNSQNDGSRSPSPPVFSANPAVAYPPLTVANSDLCEEDAVESDQQVSLKDMFKTIDPTTSPFC